MSSLTPCHHDQVVEEALAAAKYRRERLEQLSVATTPASSVGGRGGKRKNLPKNHEPTSAASQTVTPSTSATDGGSEKVTPDPKHIRTGSVEPKVLFASPDEAPDASMIPSEGWVL